ncbi:hypothetical protein [Streptomyces sp. NPDC051572]|uniref:hypothetical protein n=1 Tax=Streptomyces sp. NPDC051572 TaxID=3155802 RepID=UPI00344C8C07
MTLYGIAPAAFRRVMAPENGRDHAREIAAVARNWWLENRGGSSDLPIALGTLAALALAAPPTVHGPDYGDLLIPLDDEQLVDALRSVWNSFWHSRPELVDVARPLHGWLEDPSDGQVRGLSDYARVLIRAGVLEYVSDVRRCEADDILGLLVQQMRSYEARQKQGQFFTPAIAANALAEVILTDRFPPGTQFLEPCAGTGTMIRAGAATLRFQGLEPASYRWWMNDLDEVNAACCAASSALWRLGPNVTITQGNSLRPPSELEQSAQERSSRVIQERRRSPLLYETRTRPACWPA